MARFWGMRRRVADREWRHELFWTLVSYLALAFLLFVVAWVAITAAFARGGPRPGNPPAISEWYSQQVNAAGQWCCDKADGHDYYGAYHVNADGSVTLASGRRIPAEKVLAGRNPTGHAVWWYVEHEDGSHDDYCFALGPGM